MEINELILYRNFKTQDILEDICSLFDGTGSAKLAFDAAGRLLTLSNEFGFEGNLWHTYLTYLLVNNENSFSMSCEISGKVNGTINDIARHDFGIFADLFGMDITDIDRKLDIKCFGMLSSYIPVNDSGKTFNKRIRDRICDLSRLLASSLDTDGFMEDMVNFYRDFGVGKFGLHKAFRLRECEDGSQVIIEPITRVLHVKLDDLVGYEMAKKKLTENTEAFVSGSKANNCLLFGDAGTGKSSSIKGILNQYYDRGLRIIEVYKHQFRFLNDVVAQIKNRNYKFIIYMDDLSFEDTEIEYKYLKAVIEGGLEKKPDNILIYATSNRRHLIHENFSDKLDRRDDDDIHESDTVQEKLSLAGRFGVTIYFGKPAPDEFRNIVTVLADRYGIEMPNEELLAEANKWELSHGGLSGRTAQQFIDHLIGTRQRGGNQE